MKAAVHHYKRIRSLGVTMGRTLQKDSRDKLYKNVNSRVKFPAVLLSIKIHALKKNK